MDINFPEDWEPDPEVLECYAEVMRRCDLYPDLARAWTRAVLECADFACAKIFAAELPGAAPAPERIDLEACVPVPTGMDEDLCGAAIGIDVLNEIDRRRQLRAERGST